MHIRLFGDSPIYSYRRPRITALSIAWLNYQPVYYFVSILQFVTTERIFRG